jgi:hypothetical protein
MHGSKRVVVAFEVPTVTTAIPMKPNELRSRLAREQLLKVKLQHGADSRRLALS